MASTDVDAVLGGADAVAYMASGDIRPDEAVADIERCLRAGAHVVTPSLYSLYDPTSAPAELRDRLAAAAAAGGASLFVSGVDPGWANDALAVIAAGLCTRIDTIQCQEIFDYSTYNQPHSVRVLCGFGGSMDDVPMMLLPSIPTMVWGGNVRLIARGLGLEIDEITEELERRPLEASVDNVMGHFEAGTQGAYWVKVIGSVAGRRRVVIDHITRDRPGVRTGLAHTRRGRRRSPRDRARRSGADHLGARRRSRRHPGRRRQHHRGQPTAGRTRMAGRSSRRPSTTGSRCRCARNRPPRRASVDG